MVEPPAACASAGNPIRTYRQASRQMASRPSASTVIHPLVCLRAAMLGGSLCILPPELMSSELPGAAVAPERLHISSYDPIHHYPDNPLKYLQLRAALQSHFRNSQGALARLLGNGDGLGKPEGDRGFCGDGHIFIAGKGGARSSCTGSQQATDQGALATTGETADQRATASAAANEPSGTLALAFICCFIGT